VAKRFNVAVIDGKQVPINPEDETERLAYIRDGLHPNTKGHAIYGKFIYDEIIRLKG
jgi:lysophospholipase L1-like esterase